MGPPMRMPGQWAVEGSFHRHFILAAGSALRDRSAGGSWQSRANDDEAGELPRAKRCWEGVGEAVAIGRDHDIAGR